MESSDSSEGGEEVVKLEECKEDEGADEVVETVEALPTVTHTNNQVHPEVGLGADEVVETLEALPTVTHTSKQVHPEVGLGFETTQKNPLLQALYSHPELQRYSCRSLATGGSSSSKKVTLAPRKHTLPQDELPATKHLKCNEQHPWRRPSLEIDRKAISKTLIWILRHGAYEYSLHITKFGFVSTHALLKLPEFAGVTVTDIGEICSTDEKERFTMKWDQFGLGFIAAWTGHTLPGVQGPAYLSQVEPPPVLLHGSFWKHHHSIRQWGLCAMKNRDVHLVDPSQPNNKWRPNLTMKVKVDTVKARALGCQFHMAGNQVWLCDRTVPPTAILTFESWDL